MKSGGLRRFCVIPEIGTFTGQMDETKLVHGTGWHDRLQGLIRTMTRLIYTGTYAYCSTILASHNSWQLLNQ